MSNATFIVTETQTNEYLHEYPKGTQTSILGVFDSLAEAKKRIASTVDELKENWADSRVDEDLTDDVETVVWGYEDETVVFIFKIHMF